MIKNFFSILFLLSFFVSTFNTSAEAFLFKKKKSSGSTAAVQNQQDAKKILLVEIFASWCPGCKNIQPTLDQLEKDVADIKMILLDVSTPSKSEASEQLAKDLGIQDFYRANKNKTATVGVITPESKETIAVFNNENNPDTYKSAIQEAKTKAAEQPPPS